MTPADPAGPVRPAPLVDPAPELTAEQRARAERQILLPGFGEIAQRRLRAARVLVIGAGGLGSASIPYLAGAGVGTIGVVDDDVVELSNLHRQIAHGTADLGRPKAESIADAVRAIDPAVAIEQHRFRLTAANALDLFPRYDLVIDGSDNFPTRYLANDAAELAGIPLVWGAILQYHGQVGVAWHAHGPGYRDLFPAPPAPEDVLSCGTGGVLPGLCGTVGSLLATEAMKLVTGIGEPLIGRVLLYDALAARTRELPYRRDPGAEPVRGLVDYEAFCAGPDPAPPAITAVELAERLRAQDPPRLLDVRSPAERERLRIPGSLAVPIDELEREAGTAGAEGLGGSAITVYCERDPRSIRAARILARRGHADVRYLRGGIRALAEIAPEALEGDDRER
ncbi:ThiF family adenylyltransferase [Leucobacter sp. CSA1]|uniref:ThiF family adenylyltransferase n=1 Tax=Leucobacter chromiisoli TaxID=2796471 RepID=A0A934Q683_9MICO|nr:ThiF family adenylyltransferase [Leucobacter chromiisoli]MBK0417612.1 ThiF family adenylyltransferase [Leucobacter chromiisoli]